MPQYFDELDPRKGAARPSFRHRHRARLADIGTAICEAVCVVLVTAAICVVILEVPL